MKASATVRSLRSWRKKLGRVGSNPIASPGRSLIQLKDYTGAEMIRRAFAFIVAVLVIAAPVAVQMCGAACSEGHGGAVAQDHSAHHTGHLAHQSAAGAEPAAIHSLPRTCGDLQAVVSSSRDTAPSVAGPAVKSALRIPAVARSAASFDADARRAPPRPIRSISLLRI